MSSRWLTPETAAKMRAVCLRNLDQARRKRWIGRLPVPQHVHPLVRQFFELMNYHRETMRGIADRVGCQYGTLADWRWRSTPNLVTFAAALNALGYELRIVKRRDDSAT